MIGYEVYHEPSERFGVVEGCNGELVVVEFEDNTVDTVPDYELWHRDTWEWLEGEDDDG